MWIFGYGSLMFDGWETACGCIDRRRADLPGYRRSFNKKSVESRGTRATPGLTLNLARAEGEVCRGIAFAFEDHDHAQQILLDLEKREACKRRALAVQLEDGHTVTAQVFIYEGQNLIDDSMPLADKADIVIKAAGIRGSDFDYVRDTYEGLKRVGVDAPAVTAVWEAVKKRPGRPKLLCIFCDNELDENTKPEHILISALGGRKTSRRIVCTPHNEEFGSTIDSALAGQVAIIRNMLQLESGTGNAPPMLKKIQSGEDVINIRSDGTPELAAKPFTINDRGDGIFDIHITARSEEELKAVIPHIAAKLRVPEDQLRDQMTITGSAAVISKPPGEVHHRLSLGGIDVVRSMTKSCLELWTTVAGNDEVRSAPYDAVRRSVLSGGEEFYRTRVRLDSRLLPHVDELKRRFGAFFNLIYVRSDDAGRIVAHLTLYNMIGWQIVLAESNGTPGKKVGLISNALDPAVWSGEIAGLVDIPFAWLNGTDHSDSMTNAHARMVAAAQHHHDESTRREIERIADEVFRKYGIMSENDPVTDPIVQKKIIDEVAWKVAHFGVRVPHAEPISPEKLAALLKKDEGS
jgi:cation transport regulator ChaC